MSQLFSPYTLGQTPLKNRIAIAPMCQYSATDGLPADWHMIHLGHLALSGAALWQYSRPQSRDLRGDASLGTNRGVALREIKTDVTAPALLAIQGRGGDLQPDLAFGDTQAVELTYRLPSRPPRSGGFSRVNPAFVTFPAPPK